MTPPDRFRPLRAGIINLWDYRDEEFVFADGRLLLRGPNGSGKTKALEVLFPFVLDGRIEPRRLNPFASEERTMKSNLLYRGQDSAYSYVWLEFSREGGYDDVPGETEFVTVGVGLRATRQNDRVGRWHFVTDGRVGIDFSLLTGDDRPVTKRELTEQLPTAVVTDRSADHRAAVDERLYGLGSERYEQMLTLILTLRRPQLAKNLDPKTLSQALTDGLRPLDGDLVVEAARSFSDMEQVQHTLANVAAADDAARGFLADYTTYVRTHARAAADRVTSRLAEIDHAGASLAVAWQERRSAAAERDDADRENADAAATLETLRARLESLRASPGYRDRQQLNRQAELVAELDRAAQQAHVRAAHADREAARRESQLSDAADALRQAEATLSRESGAAVDAAGDAGIDWSAEDADSPDATTRAAARIEMRNGDVAAVREALASAVAARRDRDAAERRASRAQQQFDEVQEELAAAEAAARAAEEQLVEALATWGHSHTAVLEAIEARSVGDTPSDSTPLASLTALVPAVVDGSGETLAGRFDAVVGPVTDDARATIARREEQAGVLADRLAELRETRQQIADEKDDAPPPFAARTADRRDRAGAPLWQLVRFVDGVSDDDAAGIEAALHASNVLDAWVIPTDEDGDDFDDSIAAIEGDTVLTPLPPSERPDGDTLERLLVPDDPVAVSAERVAAILASIRLTDANDPMTQAAGPASRTNPAPTANPAPTVSTAGAFRSGLQAGSHYTPAARYIGAAARARRREQRLATLDEEIGVIEGNAAAITRAIDEARDLLRRVAEARSDLPTGRDVLAAAREVDRAAGRFAATRGQAADAASALDEATAALTAATATVGRIAAGRALPDTASGLDAVSAAIDSFRRYVSETSTARGAVGDRKQRHAVATAELESAQQNATEQSAAAERATADQSSRQEELDTLRQAIGASAEKIDADIAETNQDITDAKQRVDAALTRAREASARVGAAESSCDGARDRLTHAITECQRDAAGLRPFAAPELLEVLDINTELHWPGTSSDWPEPGTSAAAADAHLAREASYSPLAIPEAIAAIHHAITDATAQLTPSAASLKSSSTRMSSALDTLQARLSAAGHDYRPEWDNPDGIIVVRIADEDGYTPIGRFADRIATARGDQEQLLSDSERRILEDALLGRLAQQIHSRTLQARDLIGRMSTEMKRRRMSSGAAIGISWVLADDADPRQRRASALLDKDAARLTGDDLAELRAHFAERIKDLRAARPDRPYPDILAEALDYRRWRTFQLTLTSADGRTERLTKRRHSTLSGGEQSVSLHLPLFAAAHVMLASAEAHAPRLVAMDEAFAGIDDAGRGELLGLTVDFELDLFMTGHDLWATYDAVPGCAHYDLQSSAVDHTVSALLLVWDGGQLTAEGPQPDLAAALGSPGTRRAGGAMGAIEDEPAMDGLV